MNSVVNNHDTSVRILIDDEDESEIGLKGRDASIQFIRLAQAFNDMKNALLAERSRCLKAVDDEPELPEDLPESIRNDIERFFLLRATVRRVKQNIHKRIEEGL